jgi:protein-disulfide isomerase
MASDVDARVTLVMVEQPGCPYCARWHREIGPAYANSPEGRFAPLVRRMQGDPALAGIPGLNYSPTFILMRGSNELGRITGYPGADFFWPLLDELLIRAGYRADAAPSRN